MPFPPFCPHTYDPQVDTVPFLGPHSLSYLMEVANLCMYMFALFCILFLTIFFFLPYCDLIFSLLLSCTLRVDCEPKWSEWKGIDGAFPSTSSCWVSVKFVWEGVQTLEEVFLVLFLRWQWREVAERASETPLPLWERVPQPLFPHRSLVGGILPKVNCGSHFCSWHWFADPRVCFYFFWL